MMDEILKYAGIVIAGLMGFIFTASQSRQDSRLTHIEGELDWKGEGRNRIADRVDRNAKDIALLQVGVSNLQQDVAQILAVVKRIEAK